MTPYNNWALVAVTACVLGATECSVLRAHTRPRLSTSMRFFALSWAVLLPFYALQQYLKTLPALGLVAEFLPTYSGVLLLLSAEPLWREARRNGVTIGGPLLFIDYVAERSLYLLVVPHAILFMSAQHDEQLIFMRLLDLILAAVGFGSIGFVSRKLTTGHWSRVFWWGFLFVAAAYFIGQTFWTVDFIMHPIGAAMKNGFIITFALCKVALSATFLAMVMSMPGLQKESQGTSDQLHAGATVGI